MRTQKAPGVPVEGVSPRRSVGLALLVGVLHAAVLLVVALDLGYSVGPREYGPLGIAWRYGGLVVVAALPTWLAVRFRLVTPLVALTLTSGYVLGMELSPPGPTFRDVAELEGFSEPTGITVVENGLYVVRYMVNASVWTVGFLLLGSVEYVLRTTTAWAPEVREPWRGLALPASRREAASVAVAGGLLHAGVMVWFAHRLGISGAGWPGWGLYLYGGFGMWLVAAIPLYFLLRRRLFAPATLLAAYVLLDVRAEFSPGPDGPHALYFGAWFFYLALLLVAAGVEYGLRRLEGVWRSRSAT